MKPGASALVRRVEDQAIAAIVGTWPPEFEPLRARTLGFARTSRSPSWCAPSSRTTWRRPGPNAVSPPETRQQPLPSTPTDSICHMIMPNRPHERLNAAARRSKRDLALPLLPLDVADVDSRLAIQLSRAPPPARTRGEHRVRREGRHAGPRSTGHRRPLGEAVLHAPQTLRALVRADEIWLVALAGLRRLRRRHHGLADDRDHPARPPGAVRHRPRRAAQRHGRAEPAARTVLVPTLGGLALGLVGLGIARWRPRRAVDPIEANALYGGRMSLNDSLVVVLQTMHVERRRRLGRAGGAATPRSASAIASRLRAHASGCGATTCACWWAAAPPAPSPAPSTPR